MLLSREEEKGFIVKDPLLPINTRGIWKVHIRTLYKSERRYIDYAPLWKRRAYCFAPVGRYVGMSVSLNIVQLITQERFAPEASNLVDR